MSTHTDLVDPTVTGPPRAVAISYAVHEALRKARRAEPGRPGDVRATLEEARSLLVELNSELSAWEAR